MEFIDKIKSQGKITYKGIDFKNNIILRVKASDAHYCVPKYNLNLEDYTHMEFSLFRDNNFCTVENILPNFTQLHEIEEYQDTVYGYVPVELIECLYQELKLEYGDE